MVINCGNPSCEGITSCRNETPFRFCPFCGILYSTFGVDVEDVRVKSKLSDTFYREQLNKNLIYLLIWTVVSVVGILLLIKKDFKELILIFWLISIFGGLGFAWYKAEEKLKEWQEKN